MSKIIERLRKCWNVITINTINSYQEETAHFWNNWGNCVSTVTYTFVVFLFYKVLILKFNTIAGYGFNELLLLNFFGQIFYYFTFGFFKKNIDNIIQGVKKGTLDFVLLRPIPSLFYISFRSVPLVSTFRDSLINLSISALIIDWRYLNLNPHNFFVACVMLFFGMIIWHCIGFILAFAVFWFGESKRIYVLSQNISDNKSLPFELLPKNFKLFFTFLIPTTLAFPLAVSVALSKSIIQWIFWSFIVTVFFLWLKNWVWKQGLKAYTSAS